MSVYDIHAGRLFHGLREFEGLGQYVVCSASKEIMIVDSIEGIDGMYVTSAIIEDLLYSECKYHIDQFAETEDNKNVYTFSIYTDSMHGTYIVYLNNLNELDVSVKETFASNQESEEASNYQQRSLEQIRAEMKYAEGDFAFSYEELPEQLEQILHMYYCINMEEPDWLRNEQTYIFDKSITDNQLYFIAINVIRRLEPDFKKLDQTKDFIAYVSSADGDGGDYWTYSTLMRMCVSKAKIYEAIPEERVHDAQFKQAIEEQSGKAPAEQLHYWMNEIKNNKWRTDDSVITRCVKTDYFAYQCLIGLGKVLIPEVERALLNEADGEMLEIYNMLLIDLHKQEQ